MYKAIPHFDFYYLRDDEELLNEGEIELTSEEYTNLLYKNNSLKNEIRMTPKGLDVCSIFRPSPYHEWSLEKGGWVENSVEKEKYLVSKYVKEVEEGIEWASSEIDNLQELVDFDEADEEDQEHLLLAKKYRVALNKIKRSLDYPNLEVELPERPY